MSVPAKPSLLLHWPLLAVFAVTLAGLALPLPSSLWSGGALSRLALGWDAGVLVYLAVAAGKVLRGGGPDAIRRRADDLDEHGAVLLPLALFAAVASIAVVVTEGATASGGANAGVHAAVALATVALSWTFVHVLFAFHYAHRFYAPAEGKKGDRGGLVFPGDEDPDYADFLHFSIIIGVASQTADIQISDKGLRRLSTLHSLTAFVFNTVVVALTVNLAVSLLGGN